MTTHNLLFLIV